mmetsp:Transcript_15765/g.55014  ORF Transcript_15765/g.55014 Transcript_15765/m.55014 type:complete len:207 (+) Transcript_15765:197-817(+)
MLCDVKLAACSIILASGSPRRRELLAQLLPGTARFEVITSAFAEDLSKGDDPAAYVVETARAKGRDVLTSLAPPRAGAFIISADTVVVHRGVVLEKPADDDAACAMLRQLSGGPHDVLTGCALFYEGREHAFYERTAVVFSELSDEVIHAYVATGDPLDKAGAYGIQGRAGAFVERISGCYYNVVGLPINRLSREMAGFLAEPPPA